MWWQATITYSSRPNRPKKCSHLRGQNESTGLLALTPSRFHTKRLVLFPTDLQDAEFFVDLLNTPKWHHYIGDRNVRSIEDAKAYIKKRILPQFERLGYGNYTVILKPDDQKIGTCGLYSREGRTDIDIGFAFLPQFEGFGFATEACTRLIDVAFNDFGLKELKAFTMEENHPSRKLLSRLGMKVVGECQLPDDEEVLLEYELRNEG